jgi:predicted amino acid dehydrogenase
VTGNCLRIRTSNIALTSGNALTLGMAVEALKETASENGMELSGAQIAVVGVPGNIASTAALMLAPYASELILVQRTSNAHRTDTLVEEIATINPGVRVEVTDDLHSLRRACLILSASTSGGGIIQPCHLSMERVIICDIAAPPDVSHEVLHERPNAIVLSGGIVRLTNNDDFYIPGIPLKRGRVFACMAETLLMGLEDIREHQSYGRITREQVEQMMSLATKHGFGVDAVQRRAAQPDPSVAF